MQTFFCPILQLGGVEAADYHDDEPKKHRLFSKSKPSDLIASYSAAPDQSTTPTHVTIRSISDEPDGKDAHSAHVTRPPQHYSPVVRLKASPKRRAPQASPTVVRQPRKPGGSKGVKNQMSSMENLLSSSSGPDSMGEQDRTQSPSSQNSEDDFSCNGMLNNENGVPLTRPDSSADSANQVPTSSSDSARVASANGRASLKVRIHADSANGGKTRGRADSSSENRSSQFSNGGGYAASASNRVSMASRASMLSRDASVEDILQKLLQEESDVPMSFPKEQVSISVYTC